MKKISIEELKKIQINILDYVDQFCRENKINYWLSYGSLLGAVRHKGYIPWDDDIDIGMLRDDYERFIAIFNKKNNKYRVCDYSIDHDWPLPYGKILDTTTLMYEPDKKSGITTAVFVDLFIYDDAPNNKQKLKRAFKKRTIYRKLHLWQTYKEAYNQERKKYNFIRYPIHLFLQLFPKNYFLKRILKIEVMFRNNASNKVASISDQGNYVFDKNVLEELTELEFEGKKFYAPQNYDLVLRTFYGDYMKLPPKEKRVSHHRFEAYYKE